MEIENSAEEAQVRSTNMTVLDIKKLRDRAPFRPFRLHLTNGETLPVQHPEYLAVPPEPGTELFVVWIGVHWNLVDAGLSRKRLLGSPAYFGASGSSASEILEGVIEGVSPGESEIDFYISAYPGPTPLPRVLRD